MFLPANPQYGWACGFGGYVLRTTDGGATWEGTTIPNADQLESIIFVNERVGYCSGTNNGNPNRGGIYKSTDGGRSWREITPVITINGVLQRAPVWGCYFLDENTGMVVGGGCEGWAQLFSVPLMEDKAGRSLPPMNRRQVCRTYSCTTPMVYAMPQVVGGFGARSMVDVAGKFMP